MVRLIALALLVAAAACGNINRKDPYDAGVSEPPQPPPDTAPIDAAQLHEARELVGGARMKGATYTFDVEVGHAVQQGKMAGATYQFQASPAVQP
jgi:hypothetical protein